MSKENLITKIIEDAQSQAQQIRQKAQNEYNERLQSATDQANAQKEQIINQALAFCPEQEQRIMTVAELECRKIDLKMRKELLSEAFEQAKQKVMQMPKEDYVSLITDMIRKVGEDGDQVVISKNDKDRLTSADIKKISDLLGIKLTLADEVGDFCGGVILRQNGCDKNMTIEIEFAEILDKFEARLSSKLFKDIE